MKKLLAIVLVLGMVSAAGAAMSFTPEINGSSAPINVAGAYAVDIMAADAVGGLGFLKSTGELAVVCTGGVTITGLPLTYKGAGDAQPFWDTTLGLVTQAVVDDAQNARVGAATLLLNTMFMLNLDDLCIEDIMINFDGNPGTLSIVPNNQPNPFGNAGWFNGTEAGDDLQATGGGIEFVPEPITLSLLALGGIGALRRRR